MHLSIAGKTCEEGKVAKDGKTCGIILLWNIMFVSLRSVVPPFVVDVPLTCSLILLGSVEEEFKSQKSFIKRIDIL